MMRCAAIVKILTRPRAIDRDIGGPEVVGVSCGSRISGSPKGMTACPDVLTVPGIQIGVIVAAIPRDRLRLARIEKHDVVNSNRVLVCLRKHVPYLSILKFAVHTNDVIKRRLKRIAVSHNYTFLKKSAAVL